MYRWCKGFLVFIPPWLLLACLWYLPISACRKCSSQKPLSKGEDWEPCCLPPKKGLKVPSKNKATAKSAARMQGRSTSTVGWCMPCTQPIRVSHMPYGSLSLSEAMFECRARRKPWWRPPPKKYIRKVQGQFDLVFPIQLPLHFFNLVWEKKFTNQI